MCIANQKAYLQPVGGQIVVSVAENKHNRDPRKAGGLKTSEQGP